MSVDIRRFHDEGDPRRCPGCFRMKVIPAPLPVCRKCIGLVPNKLQSALASAFLAGDAKAQIAAAGAVVTAAWDAAQQKKKAPKALSVGAE